MINFKPDETQDEYEYTRDMYYNYFKDLAINQFEYEGLEALGEDVTSEIIEELLFENGQIGGYKDKNLGILLLKAAGSSKLNVYNKPTSYILTGTGYSRYAEKDNVAIIKNTYLAKPTSDMVFYYCCKLAEITITMNLALNAQKVPYIIECSKNTELTAKNIFKDIRAGKPVIFKNKNKMGEEIGINVSQTNANYILDKLADYFNYIVAQILTLLGIDNYIEDKAERVQSAEVESNKEYILDNFNIKFESRKKGFDNFNKMFGTNIIVKPHKPIEKEEPEEPEELEEIENE